jgi:hypothetical protein
MMYLSVPAVPPQIVAWVHKYAARNFWKVDGLCDKEDLIQEGYFAIAYCLDKYGKALKPPHLMRLVQMTFSCAIIDIAKKRTRLAETHASDYGDDDEFFWTRLRGPDTSSELDRLVATAPESVRKALLFLMNDYRGTMRAEYPTQSYGKETTSSRVSRSIGIDSDIFLMDKIRSYLKGGSVS